MTDEQVHIEILERLGWSKLAPVGGDAWWTDIESGIREQGKGRSPDGFCSDIPELDHSLVWEAEEKLLSMNDMFIYIELLINSQYPFDYTSLWVVRHAPAIVCLRAILKALGVKDVD